jgi:hypothetical protein
MAANPDVTRESYVFPIILGKAGGMDPYEEILNYEPAGSWLLRPSITSNCLHVLCVTKKNENGSFDHGRWIYVNKEWHYVDSKDSQMISEPSLRSLRFFGVLNDSKVITSKMLQQFLDKVSDQLDITKLVKPPRQPQPVFSEGPSAYGYI